MKNHFISLREKYHYRDRAPLLIRRPATTGASGRLASSRLPKVTRQIAAPT
jgi:hypothetical protein